VTGECTCGAYNLNLSFGLLILVHLARTREKKLGGLGWAKIFASGRQASGALTRRDRSTQRGTHAWHEECSERAASQ
jgi:hypothetical protein